MLQTIYKIIILGHPASGKGTQAEFLSEKLKIPTISMGQIFRDEVLKQTEIGKQIEESMTKGELISNSIAHKLAKQRVKQKDCQNGFIFDGFPRSVIQAKFMETFTNITNVLLIKVSDQEVKHRLSGRRTCSECGDVYHLEFNAPKRQGVCDECGGVLEIRDDDTEQGIHKRLEIYHKETEEVVEYYQGKGILIEVNGEQSIGEVRDEMFKKLKLI